MLPTIEEQLTARRIYDPNQSYNNAAFIEIDGACRNNGYHNAEAGCGIYYSFPSPHGEGSLIPEPRPTSQRAELYAAIVALDTSVNFGDAIRGRDLILQTDSAYLVNSMTVWINEWRRNDFMPAGGHVVNEDLFQRIDSLIFELLDVFGVQVRFKKVPRQQNQRADRLAKGVLNQTSPPVLDLDALDLRY